jgi:hypothetical protein
MRWIQTFFVAAVLVMVLINGLGWYAFQQNEHPTYAAQNEYQSLRNKPLTKVQMPLSEHFRAQGLRWECLNEPLF